MAEINALHPFRDGNGRSLRAFIDDVSRQAGHSFQWSKTNTLEIRGALNHSFNIDNNLLKTVLEKTIVTKEQHLNRDKYLLALSKNDKPTFDIIKGILNAENRLPDESKRQLLADAATDKLIGYVSAGQSIDKFKPKRLQIVRDDPELE